MYYNQESIDTEKYGADKVIKESSFSNVQVDETKPNWTPVYINRNLLSDQTEYL